MSIENPIERFVPEMKGQIKDEHFHRYAMARPLSENRDVLDLACGDGYGAAQLAEVARSVVGVDIEPSVIKAATGRYTSPHLTFCVGSCDAIPLSDASIDVVVSFETLEHHDKHDEMMFEVKRVLRSGGSLLISSPNRLSYSEEANHHNPFHVKELSQEEFVALLQRHFRHVQVFGQKFAVASFVFPLQPDKHQSWGGYTSRDNRLLNEILPLEAPVYFVAICSDAELGNETLAPSLYLDNETINFHVSQEREARAYTNKLQSRFDKMHAHPLMKTAVWFRKRLGSRA